MKQKLNVTLCWDQLLFKNVIYIGSKMLEMGSIGYPLTLRLFFFVYINDFRTVLYV